MSSSVRWKVGQLEVEIAGENSFIEKHLAEFEAKFLTRKPSGGHQQLDPVSPVLQSDLSPGEFYRSAGMPQAGLETLLVLGSYLHGHKGKRTFTKADIQDLAGEIRIKDVHSQYYTNAFKRGLIRELDGEMAITLPGDNFVRELLNRQANQDGGAAR